MAGTLVGGCRCATSWSDLDLTFDLAVVTLTLKSCPGPRGLECVTNLQEFMCWESLLWLDLTLDPSFKVKLLWPNLKVPISRLLLVLEENMCWESFDVVRFDLGPLVQGQTMMPISRLLLVLLLVKRGWPSLKVPISSLLLLPEVWDVKLTLNSTFLLPGGRSYHCSGLVFIFI